MSGNPLQVVSEAVAAAITAGLADDQPTVDAVMAEVQEEVGPAFPDLHTVAVYGVIAWLLGELATERHRTVPEEWASVAGRMAAARSMNP